VLAERLTQAIGSLETRRHEFDVLLILLPDRWSAGFWGGPDEDFDLHDYLKAITAARAIPMQIVQEGRALQYSCRCSVMWRLSIAMYTKAGGVPWKLADAPEPSSAMSTVYLSSTVRWLCGSADGNVPSTPRSTMRRLYHRRKRQRSRGLAQGLHGSSFSGCHGARFGPEELRSPPSQHFDVEGVDGMGVIPVAVEERSARVEGTGGRQTVASATSPIRGG
jgi:hypothetical protein